MIAGLPLVDLPGPEKPADIRIVVAELLDRLLTRGQVVNPAVADMSEIDPPGSEPAHAQGRLHSRAFLVAAADKRQRPVDLVEQLRENIGEPGAQPLGRLLEGPGQQPRDFFHRDPAGELARLRPAHPVAHRKHEIGMPGRSLADLSQVMNLLRVKLKPEKGILVVGPDLAAVRLSEPFEPCGAWLIHGRLELLPSQPSGGWWQTRNRSSRSAHRSAGKSRSAPRHPRAARHTARVRRKARVPARRRDAPPGFRSSS